MSTLELLQHPGSFKLSVWRDYENLHEFVYRSVHGQLLVRRER
ncbi:MAG: DUF3291 domain-containing protein [Actinobacteria bacterium]|nr:DUF3291 domain-containing protein [Actinomycetota bacterium]